MFIKNIVLYENMSLDVPFSERSPLGEIFENLDKDVDDKNNRSSIDLNTRLNQEEISCCLIIDELVLAGILDAGITRQLKRLNISHKGKGREEKVNIAIGRAENKASLKDKVGSWREKNKSS